MRKLSVPENISLKKEVLKGIGYRELRAIILAVIPALVTVIILWYCIPDPGPRLLALLGLVGYVMVCYAIFASPADGSQSVYDYITRWIYFLRSQKFYPYKQEEVLYFAGEIEELKKD